MKSVLFTKWLVVLTAVSFGLSDVSFAKGGKGGGGGGGNSGGSSRSSGGGSSHSSPSPRSNSGGSSSRSSAPSYSKPSRSEAPKPSYNPPKQSRSEAPKPSYNPPKQSRSEQPKSSPQQSRNEAPKSQPQQSKPQVRHESKPQQSKPQTQPQQSGHKRTETKDGGYIEDRGNHQVKFRSDGTKEYMKNEKGTTQYRKDGSKAQESKDGNVTNFPKANNNGNGGNYSGNNTKPQTGLPKPRQNNNNQNNNQQAQNSGHKRTETKDGGYIEDRGNHQLKFRADGSKEYMKSGSRTVQYRKDGSKAQESKAGRVTTFHKDGSYDVSQNGRQQYTQQRVEHNNDTYIRRTYTQNNVTIIKNYRTYNYGGYGYYSYVPSVAYDPGYYSYLYRPWSDPYDYNWNWRYDSWYGSYHYYYRPYPRYYGPSYWITDFLIADMLATSYQNAYEARAQVDAQAAAADAQRAAQEARDAATQANASAQQQQVVLTDEIKDQIKVQVEQAIRAHEKAESVTLQQDLSLDHVFVVSEDIDVGIEGSEAGCSLTGGDLLKLRSIPAESAVAAEMIVVTGKRESCKPGSPILVSMSDLQEFQNSFVERVEKGMEKMKQEVVGKKN